VEVNFLIHGQSISRWEWKEWLKWFLCFFAFGGFSHIIKKALGGNKDLF
jgi:hypothetical protein